MSGLKKKKFVYTENFGSSFDRDLFYIIHSPLYFLVQNFFFFTFLIVPTCDFCSHVDVVKIM